MNKPTKPNITIPASFGGVKVDFDNNHLTNGFPQLTPDVLPGDCLNKFIDDTYKASNYALDLGDYVLGKDQITNCILEAPNGVLTFSGNTVTMKQGLKYLVPNGKNSNGTLKNTEVTVNSDYVFPITTDATEGVIFGLSNGQLTFWGALNNIFFYQYFSEFPTPVSGKYFKCFSYYDNRWYQSNNGGDYFPTQECFLSCAKFNADHTINYLSTDQPLKLLTPFDIRDLIFTTFMRNTIEPFQGVMECYSSYWNGYIRFINGFTIQFIRFEHLNTSGLTFTLPQTLSKTGYGAVVGMDLGMPGQTGYRVISGNLINPSQIQLSASANGTTGYAIVIGW